MREVEAFLAGFEAGYDLAVELVRGQAESHRCDSGAGQGGHGGAGECHNRSSDQPKRFSADVEDE